MASAEKVRVLAGLKRRVREAESSVEHCRASRFRLEATKARLEEQLPRLNQVLEAARESLESTRDSIEMINTQLRMERANELERNEHLTEAREELALEEEQCRVIEVLDDDDDRTPINTAINNMKTIEEGLPVQPDDEWSTVWDKLLYTGWTYEKGKGLVDWYYILPRGKLKNGRVGHDFLTSEKEVRKFVTDHFGWKDPGPGIHNTYAS